MYEANYVGFTCVVPVGCMNVTLYHQIAEIIAKKYLLQYIFYLLECYMYINSLILNKTAL